MAEIVSDLVAKLLEYIGKSVVKEIAPYFGGKRRLKELRQTMVMIQARLLDAERRGEGHEGDVVVKNWLQGLKRVLFQLEDLLEEVAMDDTMHQQMPRGKLTKPLHKLSLGSSSLKRNKKVAKEAKAIRHELKTITSLMNSLNFRELPMEEPGHVVNNVDNDRETYSFVIEDEVIGRDEDKRKILALLLNSDPARDIVCVIPIVGIAGLGKTTLAQLVFNDKDVQRRFELRRWVCISKISSFHQLAGKVLTSISGSDYRQLTLEEIQSQLRDAVEGKRYLLVLDDVWDEDRNRWLDLRSLLRGGKLGSKIIVTSRSRVVAQNMGTVGTYELESLPEGKSWELFRRLAFKEGQEEGNSYLASIGKEMLKKCANVPLAIKTIASLLYSMDTVKEWEAFKDKDLAMIEHNATSILSTLKLSYDRLAPRLKQCFTYCSLFPKNHVFLKRDLIYLWMAVGFCGSSSEHKSLEDVGHGYFMQLMRRCFFQVTDCDEDGEIISCKMHDLVHDLAQLAAGGETLLVDGPTRQFDDNIWHVSFCSSPVESPSWLLAMKHLRSLLHLNYDTTWLHLDELFSNLRFLRALYLPVSEELPVSLGELKHLRCLKLGGVFEYLPECITRLQNLQTLDLQDCERLRELPRGFSKMINLRHLHFHSSACFIDMPPGFGQLTSLQSLDRFVVGESNGLDELATLNYLVGRLRICFHKHCGNALLEAKVANLKDKKLTNLELEWNFGEPGADETGDYELVLGCLQPPPFLKRLEVWGWQGVRFPSLGMDDSPCLLPNLVQIQITCCRRCQYLPPLSRLPHLKSLHLNSLDAKEYIEMGGSNMEASPAAATEYFPSLESLTLQHLRELKGWWSKEEEEDTIMSTVIHSQTQNVEILLYQLPRPYFPRLSKLVIKHCPKLKSMPLTQRLESLEAYDIHGKLIKHLLCAESRSRATSPLHSSYLSTLQSLEIRSVPELESLSINLCFLKSLKIEDCPNLINLTAGSLMSLRQLYITRCSKLRDICGALQHFTALEELGIWDCEVLQSLKGLGFLAALQSLAFGELCNLRAIPESIGLLTQLRELAIYNCVELTALPQSFCNLTSLQRLEIWGCPELERRCEQTYGRHWPLFRLIPCVNIGY